jgi:hypothetical protein
MPKFVVQIAETSNFQIEVEAADERAAEAKAMEVWRDAPEVGGYQIPDTETEVVAVVEKSIVDASR